jgi:peptide/nickel transport system substrate-binding protein
MAEKTVFYFFTSLFVLSGIFLCWRASEAFLVKVPTQGGNLIEGVVGNPRFINPVLAISESDKNLSALIYSGLVRITPDGDIENDLAERVEISEDRRSYAVFINPDARFHDGSRVTADDVVFTVQKIIDPAIKSPRRGNWEGVNVEKIDEFSVRFTLKQAYTPFIYNLTIGLLPRHIWKNVSNDEFSFSQFNTLPIGAGPYKVEQVERNSGGIPNYYTLVPFQDALGDKPLIDQLAFKFYPNEPALIDAYNHGEIESLGGISPERIQELKIEESRVISSPLPRVFAVFFNQNQSQVLLNSEVRKALDLAAPKEAIVENVLGGFGTPIDGPIPVGVYDWAEIGQDAQIFYEERLALAKELLAKAGWKLNEETNILEKKSGSGTISLSFSISTGDAPELVQVADMLATAWGALGAEVKISTFETGDLNQNVIRPRNFDALLFGEVVGRDADLYPFWHSSQRADPGLNIALYANNRADEFLDNARSASTYEEVEKNYQAFALELQADKPAVFLYTPSFLYVVPKKVRAVDLGALTIAQDRFLGVRDWFIEEDRVWKIFIN